MDTMEFVYPEYWLQEMCEEIFRTHLKEWYEEARWVGEDDEKRLIPVVLDFFKLEMEQSLFKLAMISNAHAAMEVAPGEVLAAAVN